ncbi:MAG: HEAT repeat domain-containing protein [Bacteriovoracaceae bacterium]
MTEAVGTKKKLLEKPMFASMVVPAAIILVSALIIFGVTKMLSSERTHRDLISEMHSKTFGNRWVAAYELSKLLATSKIPHDEIPWVIANLSQIYNETVDVRTRNFIILALGTFPNPEITPTLEKALSDEDSQVKFSAVVTLGNREPGFVFDWTKLYPLLESKDAGLKQVVIFALARHKPQGADTIIGPYRNDADIAVRYAAATAMIDFQNLDQKTLSEILLLDPEGEIKKFFNPVQVESLKLNILNALSRNKISAMNTDIEKVSEGDKNVRVATKAKEVLNLLKN